MAKKGVNGRSKGVRGELEACRLLTEWWFPDEDWSGKKADELPFRRNPGSGGWDKRRAPGDAGLDTESPETFPFSLEVKYREGWDFDQLFKGNEKWPIWSWWAQAANDGLISGKVPLLIFRKNRHPWHFCFGERDFSRLDIEALRVVRADGKVFGLFDNLRVEVSPAHCIERFSKDEEAEAWAARARRGRSSWSDQ